MRSRLSANKSKIVGLAGLVISIGTLTACSSNAVSEPSASGFKPPAAPQNQFTDEKAQTAWGATFGQTPTEWAPSGNVVSDTGFRPWPNGFSFPNYGKDLSGFNKFFGASQQQEVQPMESADVVKMFGNQVCAYGSGANCTLSLVADTWRQSTSSGMNGGHCYGFAMTAANAFNGTLDPKVLKSGPSLAFAEPTKAVQRQINYDWASQLSTNEKAFKGSPEQVLNELRNSMEYGKVKYIISFFNSDKSAGHAIVPIAVLDKGDNKYDIAVWDNNYPLRSRAIHVDLNSNSWEYLVSTQPGKPDSVWSGNADTQTIEINPTAAALEQQKCAFCRGGNSGTLTMTDPVPADNAPNMKIANLDGSTLPDDSYSVIDPTSPGTDNLKGMPSLQVDPNVDFQQILSATNLEQEATTTSQVFTNGVAFTVRDLKIPSGQDAAILVSKNSGTVSYKTGAAEAPQIQAAIDTKNASFGFGYVADSFVGSTPLMVNANSAKQQLIATSEKAGPISMRLERQDRGTGATWEVNVKLPAAGALVVDYGTWKNGNTAPSVKLVTENNKTTSVKATRSK